MIAAVIFDLDGLLSDTECLHCAAYQRVLSEVGITLPEDEYASHWIRAGLGIADFVSSRELPHDPAILRRRKAVIYRQLLATSLRPMPGAIDLLRRLHGIKPLALATSAYSADARAVIQSLDMERYFQSIVTGDDVKRIKPHPDLFLLAARNLGVQPSACVVLEDAEKGVIAAVAAGMKVVVVPNKHTAGNDFSQATKIIASLDEVDVEFLDRL